MKQLPRSVVSFVALLGLSSLAYLFSVLYGSAVRLASGTPTLRVALVADSHVIGPQYQPGGESNDVDNESIMRTAARLRRVLALVEKSRPKPAIVLFAGDIVHNGYFSKSFDWYTANWNAYSIAKKAFEQLTIPVEYVWGNHDYKVVCGDHDTSFNTDFSHRLFKHFFGGRPYSSVLLQQYKLLLLNGQLGTSWDPASPKCYLRYASLGEQQLRWLNTELAEGKPTFVITHYPLSAALRGEFPGTPHPDLITVLLAHQSNILGVFAGHYHRSQNWTHTYPFPVYTLPPVRYDEDNFLILELDARPGRTDWRIVDWEKTRAGGRCSLTCTYRDNGAVECAAEQDMSDATCTHGLPTLDTQASYTLPPMTNAQDYPRESGHQFNPDGSCLVKFLEPVLDMCLKEGPTQVCCDVVSSAFAPVSSSFFPGCLCVKDFWQQAVALFARHDRDASEVFWSCFKDYDSPVQYMGRPGGSCLTPAGQLPV